jgi:hypothetical protein
MSKGDPAGTARTAETRAAEATKERRSIDSGKKGGKQCDAQVELVQRSTVSMGKV